MGIALNKTTPTESSVYSDYAWSLIKGADGVPGAPGSDGVTTYTWVKYGTSAAGAGLSDDPTGKTYIGLAFNKTTATESTVATDYTWSLIQGPAGSTGATGVGITSVTPYFQQTAAAASAPALPTASPPPAPWTSTEPAYAANTALWRTERILYTNSTFAYTAVSKVSSYAAAAVAQATADGKNQIIYSTSDATGTTFVTGDTWRKVTTLGAGGKIIKEWTFTSGAWQTKVYSGLTLTDLDAGSITTGFLDVANRIQAGSLVIGQINTLQSTLDAKAGQDYVQSRATDLVTNGTGLLGDNTNFSGFVIDKTDAPIGPALSFDVNPAGVAATKFVDEYLPVDTSKKYKFSFQAKQKGTTAGGYMYSGVAAFDAYKLQLSPQYTMYQPNTLTTLAVQLNPGDTTITIATPATPFYGSAGKNAGASTHFRSIIWWDYVDQGGKVWAPETYSRNWSGSNYWADGGITGNVITLNAPYVGPVRPVGTKLSNGSSGGTYMYGGAVNSVVPKDWTAYSATITGIATNGASPSFATGWPAGTSFARIIWLTDRTSVGASDTLSKHSVASVSLSDASAAQATADAVTTLTDGWRYTGTTEINGGSIRTDTIDVIKLKAGSTFTQDLNVANTFTLGTATLDGLIKSYGYTDAGTSGFKLAKSGLVIKGTGNVVDGATIPTNTIDVNSIKTSTLTATTINLGATGVINVDSTGSIKSNNYALNSTGYKLSNTGLEINDGSIDAKVLKTNTAIIGDLTVGQSGGASGTIKSYDYVAGSAGWKIGKNLFEINNGSIAAAALNIQQGQNIVPPAYADFEFVPSFYNSNLLVSSNATATIMTSGARFNKQYLSLRTNTAAAASVTLGTLTTDYNIPVEAGQTYIVSAWLKTGSVATATYFYPRWSTGVQGSGMYLGILPANGSWQRISSVLTVPAGVTAMNIFVYSSTTTIGAGFDIDGVQVEIKEGALNSPSTWTPPSMTSVDGGIIRTGEIRSNTNVTVNSVSQPAWSINMSGNAQFGDALVRGKMLVGQSGADVDAGQSYIASGNYVANTTGWKIDSSGNTEFNSGMYRGLLGAKVVKAGNIDVGAIDAENIKLGVFNKNLVRDPSFEETYSIDTASTSNYDKWRIIDQTVGTGGTVSAVRYASPRSGAWALKLATSTVGSPTNQIQVYSPNIAVTPGQTYVLSINAAKLTSATVRFYVRIAGGSTQDLTEYPASSPGTQIPFSGEDGATFLENQDLTNAGDPADPNAFDNFTGQFTVPAGVNWVAVRVFNWSPSSGTALVVDDVSVIPLGTGATELTSAGLRLFGPDGTEVASFVANRPNYFTVIKDGVNVATVDDSGDAAFNNGRFSGDLSVGGAPLIGPAYEDYSPGQNSPISPLSVIEQLPWGLVQWGGKYSNSGATNTTTGIGIMEIAVQILRGRMYKLCTSPLRVRSSVAGDAVEVRVHVEYGTYLNEDSFPAQPQVTSTQLCRVPISTIDNVQGEAITLNKLVQWGFADGDTITHAYNARLLLTVARVAGTGNVFVNGSSDDPIEFWLEDIGPARNSGGSDNDGGGGVIYQPAPKKTYVKTFRSTSAATYKGSGAKRTDTTDVVQGYDSYNGNGKGLWIFPTMTGYIGGSAVINKIEIYAYANHWYYNSGGTARIYAHNYSGAPGSSPSMSYVTQSTGWPKPGGRWVTLPNVGGLYNSFHDGTLKGFGMGPGPSTSKTYYGRFNGGTAALIRVTYTK
jgi:hypothetical protein